MLVRRIKLLWRNKEEVGGGGRWKEEEQEEEEKEIFSGLSSKSSAPRGLSVVN